MPKNSLIVLEGPNHQAGGQKGIGNRGSLGGPGHRQGECSVGHQGWGESDGPGAKKVVSTEVVRELGEVGFDEGVVDGKTCQKKAYDLDREILGAVEA